MYQAILVGLLLGQMPPAAPAAPATAADPAAELATRVKELVAGLDAPQKSARDEAEKQLLEIGPPILAHLPEVTARTPAETGLRLERLRSGLETLRAEQAVAGTTVTLRGEMTLSAAAAEIEKQTGNRLVDYRGDFNQKQEDKKVTLDLADVSFWRACDAFLDAGSLSIYPTPDPTTVGDGLAFVVRNEGETPRGERGVVAGSFRVEMLEVTARRDLRNPTSNMLQLLLEAAWEPRLKPIVILQPADAATAVDDAGQPITLSSAGSELETPITPGTKTVELPLQFTLPARGVERIASLKGKLLALLPGRIETFRFTKLERAKNVSQRKAGVTVVVEEVGKNDELAEIRLRIIFDEAAGALESHRNWVFDNEVYLEGSDKKQLKPAAWDTTLQEENEVGIAYLFPLDSLAGYTLVYATPAAIVNVPINYELTNLDLP